MKPHKIACKMIKRGLQDTAEGHKDADITGIELAYSHNARVDEWGKVICIGWKLSEKGDYKHTYYFSSFFRMEFKFARKSLSTAVPVSCFFSNASFFRYALLSGVRCS